MSHSKQRIQGDLGEILLKNLVSDLGYDPKRSLVYLCLGLAALACWIFAPPAAKRELLPILLGLGSVALIVKGLLLLRKKSKARIIPIESVTIAAQVIQDFGASALLLGLILAIGKEIADSWYDLPGFTVCLSGAALFVTGWLVRRYF